MANEVQSVLNALTALPSTDFPFLSIYLDWVPDGNGQRQSLLIMEQRLDEIAANLDNRHEHLESLNADRQRIAAYTAAEVPAESRGVAIFACNAENVWYTLPLQVQLETEIAVDRFPHLFKLARVVDDHETYAVVLADGQDSQIFVITLDSAEKAAETVAPEDIKRFDAGGQAQMLFQRRTDNLIKAHTKDIADELTRVVNYYDIQHIVFSSNDSVKGIVMANMPDQIKERMVDYINLDKHSNLKRIKEVVEPMIREVERQQEADLVAQLEDRIATRGGLGAVGVADTAEALSKGQVQTLIMLDGFSGAGRECPNCATLRPGNRANCPFDGSEMHPVDLKEAFVARALQQSAEVQIVAESAFLAQHDGVGVLLRYRDDVQQERMA